MRILGVDPGTRLTGYDCVDRIGSRIQHITHGTLRVAVPLVPASKELIPLEDRLLLIYQGLSKIIVEFKPDILVVEKIFFAKNAMSALKLGQARGVVLLVGKIHGLILAEYSPTEVKQAVVGHGHADKDQIAKIVQLLVGRQEFETPDASDGLALAICHAQSLHLNSKLPAADLAALKLLSRKRTKKRLSMAESVGISLQRKKTQT